MFKKSLLNFLSFSGNGLEVFSRQKALVRYACVYAVVITAIGLVAFVAGLAGRIEFWVIVLSGLFLHGFGTYAERFKNVSLRLPFWQRPFQIYAQLPSEIQSAAGLFCFLNIPLWGFFLLVEKECWNPLFYFFLVFVILLLLDYPDTRKGTWAVWTGATGLTVLWIFSRYTFFLPGLYSIPAALSMVLLLTLCGVAYFQMNESAKKFHPLKIEPLSFPESVKYPWWTLKRMESEEAVLRRIVRERFGLSLQEHWTDFTQEEIEIRDGLALIIEDSLGLRLRGESYLPEDVFNLMIYDDDLGTVETITAIEKQWLCPMEVFLPEGKELTFGEVIRLIAEWRENPENMILEAEKQKTNDGGNRLLACGCWIGVFFWVLILMCVWIHRT